MSEYKISLGVDVDVSDIQSQINTKAKDVSIPIKLEVENIGDIKKQIQGLGALKYGIEIPLSIDTSATIKSAQQVGQKIGTAITKNIKKAINIDDVIDKQVSNIMKKFAIEGEKGSKPFEAIKQALIECRNELNILKNGNFSIDEEVFGSSAAVDKVTKAIAKQMNAVNDLGDEYIKLAEYMTRFNDPKKGNKVRLPDAVKQEQGDDYKSNRGSLGIAFNTKEGISFVDFINDLNTELGQTISLTNGEAAAMDELLRKLGLGRKQRNVASKSGGYLTSTASTEEILQQNGVDREEIYEATMASVDAVNAAEKEAARISSETANIIAQNEEKKQRAYQETAGVASSIQKGSFQKAFGSADDDLGGMKNTAKSVEQYFKNLQGVISDTVSVKEQFDADGNLSGFTVSLKNANGELEQLRYTFQAATEDGKAFFKYAGGSINDNAVGKQIEKSINKANELQIKLNKIQADYSDPGASKPIKEEAHIQALSDQYDRVQAAINDVRNADNTTYASMVANAEKEKAALESLVKVYKNAETFSTDLRAKDRDTAKEIYSSRLNVLSSKMRKDGVYDGLATDVSGLKTKIDAASDVKALSEIANELTKLESKYKSAKAAKDELNRSKNVGSSVSGLKSELEILQNVSPSIKNFKTEINNAEVSIESLLKDLSQVGTKGEFDVIKGKVEAFKKAAEAAGIDLKETETETKNVNDTYQKIYNTRKKIGELEAKLIGAKAKDDKKTIEDINAEITRLKNNLTTLEADNVGSKFTDKQKYNLKELRKQNQYNKKQAQNAADYKIDSDNSKTETKRINDFYNEIYNTKKKIGELEVKLIGEEDAKNAKVIRDELDRLKTILSGLEKDDTTFKFTKKQNASLNNLEAQIDFNKKTAENKVEAKLELQIDKEGTAKAKQEAKEVKDSFEELKRLAKEMGKIDIELAGLTDVDKDIDKFNSLKRMAEELEVEFQVLYEKMGGKLDVNQVKELDQIFANTTGTVREFNSEMAKSSEASELASGLDRLKSITKEINALQIDIFKFEDAENIQQATNRLNELENEATELRATLQQKFNIQSFDEIDDIARQGKEALNDLIAKAEEAKAKLAKSIKADIELGNIDNQMDAMRTNFNSLSDANDKLRNSFEATEKAYRIMVDASKANTGDEVADRERLIQAEKEYAAALEKTNNLIKQQARADKISNDALRLQDDREIFQAKIDSWLTKNSAATERFGAKLKELRTAAETADRVELNHLEKELIKVDKEADKAGLKMMSLGDRIKSKAKEYMAYLSVAEVFMWIEQAARAMFDTVLEIDTAMTGLYRVTDLTSAQYDALFNNMIDSAKEYGATLNDIINATSDWVRAGFDADTALGLAEVTTMYQHISDLDYDTAAENLITAYNGFKNELDTAFSGDTVGAVNYIADIFNELDNNFAVTSAGLGEALTRSASALDLAGNTIQETAG